MSAPSYSPSQHANLPRPTWPVLPARGVGSPALRGVLAGRRPLRERLAALAREVLPARVPADRRSDDETPAANAFSRKGRAAPSAIGRN
jgi:hypothetical protein